MSRDISVQLLFFGWLSGNFVLIDLELPVEMRQLAARVFQEEPRLMASAAPKTLRKSTDDARRSVCP